MDAAVVEETGPVSHPAAADRRSGARPRRIGGGSPAGAHHDQPAILGGRIPADFWFGHGRGNDADHRRDRAALRLLAATFRAAEPRPGPGIGIRERRVRIIFVLPDWDRGRTVYRTSELDAAVKHIGNFTCCGKMSGCHSEQSEESLFDRAEKRDSSLRSE